MSERHGIYGLVWVTGLSAAGKTSFATLLRDYLLNEFRVNPVMLDGDALRTIFSHEKAYTPADRKMLARQYSDLSALLVAQGHCVICSTISMFQEVRDENRKRLPHYCEVFIDVDDDVRVTRRDVGSLSKADIILLDSEFQLPQHPDITLTNPSYDQIKSGCNDVAVFIRSKWIS